MENGSEIDDLVIKVLGHKERKRILKIVGSYPDGINYTGILGETGLSTGRLNYHLGELEGFLERDENRLYSLSTLGEKAVATLHFITQDIDASILESVNSKRAKRLREIRRRLDVGFYVVSIVLIGITGLMGYFAWSESDTVLAVFSGIWALMSLGLIYLMNRSRERDPERILWIVEWLEWLLFRGYKEQR
jgi:hypothetical protein